jgi:DNA-binding PucR family transcriptional regulator
MDENLLTTGLNFIENGLNISKTSNILFLHRNTLIYRLEKIKEQLNLDLKNFKDAFVFYLSVKSFFNIINNNTI